MKAFMYQMSIALKDFAELIGSRRLQVLALIMRDKVIR